MDKLQHSQDIIDSLGYGYVRNIAPAFAGPKKIEAKGGHPGMVQVLLQSHISAAVLTHEKPMTEHSGRNPGPWLRAGQDAAEIDP